MTRQTRIECLLDHMFREVSRPISRRPTGTTAGTQLQRPLEMAEFHTEPGKRCEHVDDEPTPIAGVVIGSLTR